MKGRSTTGGVGSQGGSVVGRSSRRLLAVQPHAVPQLLRVGAVELVNLYVGRSEAGRMGRYKASTDNISSARPMNSCHAFL